jgi:phosphatidate cytidylyltransferase
MLGYRLLFGALMTVIFVGVALFDGWLDGSLTAGAADKPVQGTILFILIMLLSIPAQYEFSCLAERKGIRIFLPVSIVSSMLLSGTWYWPQVFAVQPVVYVTVVMAFTVFSLLIYHNFSYGTDGVIVNCGGNCFSVVYLGLLSSFVIAIRVEFGLWPVLMYVFVVKSADIGAYTLGKLFGKHKFSPRISPGKTWEGMGGAALTAIIVALTFSLVSGIMSWLPAVLFGFCFAFVGQLGDLAESMIKRDAEQKDSASNVPGFGGILDVIDSPLVSAVFAYLFFLVSLR